MKLKSLYFGICILLSTLVAGVPAFATHTTTAFNSFHVRSPLAPSKNAYACITESYGALVNSCGYAVSVSFDLPVDTATVHTIKVQNYVAGTGTAGATCYVWSYDGDRNGSEGSSATFNPNGAQTLTFTSALFGNSLSLLCDVPVGAGIATINWKP